MSPFDPYSVMNIRSGLGISQRDFAHQLGVTQSTVHRWETGVWQPTADHLGRMHDLATEKGFHARFFYDPDGGKSGF